MIINEIIILLIILSVFGTLYKLYFDYNKSKFDDHHYDHNYCELSSKKLKKTKKVNNIEVCIICEKEFTKKKTTFKIIKPVCPSCIENIVGKDIDEYKDEDYSKQKSVIWNSDQYYNYKLNN